MAYIEGQNKGGTPLIELYDHGSKFTALKYSDFEGRNTSASGPLVKKDILDPPKSNSFSLQANARIDDLTRITKLLTKPGGIKFATNQAILNTAANRSSDNIFKRLGGGAVTALKAIGSTLAQVPVNGTGLHFVYGFGGNEYLRNGQQGTTPLGRFLRNNLNIGNQGINAGAAALAGRPIISDNTGAENYQPYAPSGLLELNSTLDLKPDEIQKSLNFLPPSFQNVAQGIRGVISNIFRKKNKGEQPSLGDFFKAQPDNLPGNVTPESSILLEKIRTNLSLFSTGEDGGTPIVGQPNTPESYLSQGGQNNVSGRDTVLGGENTVISSNTGLPDFQFNVLDNFKNLDTDIDPESGYLGRDGKTNTQTQNIESQLLQQETVIDPTQRGYVRVDGASVVRGGGRVSTNFIKGSTIDDQRSQFIFEGGDKPIDTNLAPSEGRTDIKIPLYFLKDGRKYNQSSLNFENKFWIPESNVDLLTTQTEELTGRQDIIPFRFNTFTPAGEKYLYFRAFLDSFDDKYTGDWSGTRYIGRAEEFYTYQGFSRKISFSFKVAAFSKKHLLPLYEKLNYLASATAPTYGDSGQFMRGTFCNMTIGDYLLEQDGFISSVGLSWQKEYPWEIDVDELGAPVVPHILDVSVEFTPIHNFNVKEDIDQTQDVYFGPIQPDEAEYLPEPVATDFVSRPKTAFAYFADKTIEYDIATGKTVAINGQPVKSVNGGWAYAADGRQATTTKVNGTNGSIYDAGVNDNGQPIKKVNTTPSTSPVTPPPTSVPPPPAPQPQTPPPFTQPSTPSGWKLYDEDLTVLSGLTPKYVSKYVLENSEGKRVTGKAVSEREQVAIRKARQNAKDKAAAFDGQ